jgi:carbamate kinase
MIAASRSAAIAVGGHALILEGQTGTIAEQFENARSTVAPVGARAAAGWRIILTHGMVPRSASSCGVRDGH